jgi:peptidoglycan-associated lipoprotein
MGGGPGMGQGMMGAPISERDAEVLQAELKPVYFDFDNYTLSAEAQDALRYNAGILQRVPNLAVTAEGHCDERGTSEYNLALGDRRARSSVDFLVALGFPPARFSIVSYGSELPVDPGHNESAWAKNRRVYLRVAR